ncbi:hypothetical protein [Tateyamaria sp. SN3-11]|uniref:hypothetical protein n=1 Tax=Tateyamaria sp. SN3-11 TaxID=3092147 RepID=UPI0039EC46FB
MKDEFDGVLLYQKSGFEPKNPTPNTVAFRRFIKAAPVILPDGHIAVFLTNGDLQTSGFLTKRLHRFEGEKVPGQVRIPQGGCSDAPHRQGGVE